MNRIATKNYKDAARLKADRLRVETYGESFANRTSAYVSVIEKFVQERADLLGSPLKTDLGKKIEIEPIKAKARQEIEALAAADAGGLTAHKKQLIADAESQRAARRPKSDAAQLIDYFEGRETLKDLLQVEPALLKLDLPSTDPRRRPRDTDVIVNLDDPIWSVLDRPSLANRLAKHVGQDAVADALLAREQFLIPKIGNEIDVLLGAYGALAADAIAEISRTPEELKHEMQVDAMQGRERMSQREAAADAASA